MISSLAQAKTTGEGERGDGETSPPELRPLTFSLMRRWRSLLL
jgi:hypothetical protein